MFGDEHQPLLAHCLSLWTVIWMCFPLWDTEQQHAVLVLVSYIVHVLMWPQQYRRYGFKGHSTDLITHLLSFYPPFILNSHFCHVKYLVRSVIITVSLVWTLAYTQLTMFPEFSILFCGKDTSVCHLWLIRMSWCLHGWKLHNAMSCEVLVSSSLL